MNKKQLVILCVVVIGICSIIFFAPRKYFFYHPMSGAKIMTDDRNDFQEIQWAEVVQRSLIVLIIGGFLIYTLKDK